MNTSSSTQATVAADGSATVTLGPEGGWSQWDVLSVGVQLSAGGGEARTYLGSVSPATFLEGTYSGDRDSSTFPAGSLVLEPGEPLVVQWTGATPGATATAVVRYRGGR